MHQTKEELEEFQFQLEGIFRKGVDLYIDGRRSSPEGIIDCFVNEEANYMPDYVLDETGKLVQIRYDRVRNV